MKDGYIYIHDRSARLDTLDGCTTGVGSISGTGDPEVTLRG